MPETDDPVPEASEGPPAMAPEAPPGTPLTSAEPGPRSFAPLFLKGCGFTVLAVVLGVGVFVASKGDNAALGSALVGVTFLLLILSSSGLTGFWGNDK